MNGVKIDSKLNFVIPLDLSDERTVRAVVPQPSVIAMDSVAEYLSTLYLKIKEGVHPDILIVDYALYLKKAGNENLNAVKGFLERSFTATKIIDENFNVHSFEEYEIDEEGRTYLEGFICFVACVWRYAGKKGRKLVLKDFLSSEDATGIAASLKKLYIDTAKDEKSSESTEEA